MIPAVIDTNILVSALLQAKGNPAAVVDLVLSGRVIPCISELVLKEYRDVLARPKLGLSAATAGELIRSIAQVAVVVADGPGAGLCRDPDDEVFVTCADAAAADFIVTGNIKHFPAFTPGGSRVLTPRAFLDLMQSK